MKIQTVLDTIDDKPKYLVHFEHIHGHILRTDYFPDTAAGEEGFQSEEYAIEVAEKYAAATKGKTCNFYLVRADNYLPIGTWRLQNR